MDSRIWPSGSLSKHHNGPHPWRKGRGGLDSLGSNSTLSPPPFPSPCLSPKLVVSSTLYASRHTTSSRINSICCVPGAPSDQGQLLECISTCTQAALLTWPRGEAQQVLTCHFKSDRAELTDTTHLGKSFEDGGCTSPLAKQRQGLSCKASGASSEHGSSRVPLCGRAGWQHVSLPTAKATWSPQEGAEEPPRFTVLLGTYLQQQPFPTFTGKT